MDGHNRATTLVVSSRRYISLYLSSTLRSAVSSSKAKRCRTPRTRSRSWRCRWQIRCTTPTLLPS